MAAWAVQQAPPLHQRQAAQAAEMLEAADVPGENGALLEIVARRLPDPEIEARIAASIGQLSSDLFERRERATRELIALGLRASGQVQAAMAAPPNLETRLRLEHVLGRIDAERDDQLLWAALIRLRTTRPPEAVEPLLRLLPRLPSRRLQAPATEIICRAARPAHRPLLERLVASDETPLSVRGAALVALERMTGDAAPAAERSTAESSAMRLAAARVLAAHRPREAAELLLAVRQIGSQGERAEAEYLLQLFHRAVEGQPPSRRSTPDQWRLWLATNPALEPLDDRRHRWGVLHLGIQEDFEQSQADVTRGYGDFIYQSTVASKAAVRNGRLELDGKHPEGDQRLAITTQSLAAEPRLENPLTVSAKIGGLPGNEVGWHVGVSVGNIKVLIHPGYQGGAFRIETVDSHTFIVGNQTMPFTPATGKLHPIRVRVTPADDGGAKLEVEVEDADSGAKFRHVGVVSREQIGPIDRIGLERSGREGGAAIFDDWEITLDDP